MSSPPALPGGGLLPSPLKALDDRGLVLFSPKSSRGDLTLEVNKDTLFDKSSHSISLELLSVQSEMLLHSKEVEGEAEALHASFEGVTISQTPSKSGKYRVDVYDSDIQKIHMCPLGLDIPVSVLFAHEMTHAIDDIYDDRKSGDRTVAVLKFRDDGSLTTADFQKSTIELVASTFAAGDKFLTEYRNPAFSAKASFVEACESADIKSDAGEVLNRQEKNASNLSIEFSSFAFETLYYEMAKSGVGDFLAQYKGLLPTESVGAVSSSSGPSAEVEHRKSAQEVIAVAMYDINDCMIQHISKKEVLSGEREELLKQLVLVQREIEPAYMRSAHKVVQCYRNQVVAASAELETSSVDREGLVKRIKISTGAAHTISERVKSYQARIGKSCPEFKRANILAEEAMEKWIVLPEASVSVAGRTRGGRKKGLFARLSELDFHGEGAEHSLSTSEALGPVRAEQQVRGLVRGMRKTLSAGNILRDVVGPRSSSVPPRSRAIERT